jgi:hypothetical protein
MKACQLCRFMFFCWILQSTHFIATTKAQGFLDQFRDRVEGEIRQALGSERNQPSQQFRPPVQKQSVPWEGGNQNIPSRVPWEGGNQNNPSRDFRDNGNFVPQTSPPARSQSVPSEGGNQNNPGGNFRDSGNFLQPTSRPPSNMGNSRTIPRTVNPSQQSSLSGTPTTGTNYREVPVRQTATNGQPIKLKLPNSMPQPVQYQLVLGTRSYDYQMHPGESQTFNETTQWLIRYRSEGSETTYRLRGGKNYEFEVDSQGGISLFEARPDEFPEPPKR